MKSQIMPYMYDAFGCFLQQEEQMVDEGKDHCSVSSAEVTLLARACP